VTGYPHATPAADDIMITRPLLFFKEGRKAFVTETMAK
jgi:hypothetical protein